MIKMLNSAWVIVGLAQVSPALAQNTIPGVEQVSPGVQRIDGAKVPSQQIDGAALEAHLKANTSFAAAKKLLGRNGIASVGPQGTTTYMYKVHDIVTGKDQVVILFVKGDKILEHMIS